MIGMSKLVSLVFLGLVFIGCKDNSGISEVSKESGSFAGAAPSEPIVPKPVQLSERDCELIHFVLSAETIPDGGSALYLTPTVREQWNQQGDWVPMPTQFEPWLGRLAAQFRPADGAKLDKETDAMGTMVWISVKEWISDKEVTLEFGHWGGPLDASGKTITCSKTNGKWQIKDITNVWLS
jgi:hypothetical protein